MEQITKSKAARYVCGALLIMIGIFLTILGVFDCKLQLDRKKEWTPVQATIYDLNTRKRGLSTVYISYLYNSVEYKSTFDRYKIGMRIGDEVTIYVNPDNPDQETGGLIRGSIIIVLTGIHILQKGISIIRTTKGKSVPEEDSLPS